MDSIRRASSRLLRAFLACTSGSIAIVYSVSAVGLLAASGAALDYLRVTTTRDDLQQAMDSAVLAGVAGSAQFAEQKFIAEAYFAANKPAINVMGAASFVRDGEKLVGRIGATIDTTLMRVVGIDTLDIAVTSAASGEVYREPACVMAMEPHLKHTLELKGSVDVIGPDCNFYGNSDHPYDVVDPHQAENFLVGRSVAAVGGGHHYLANVTPPVEFATEVIADPLASMAIPLAGSCNYTAKTVSGTATTLSPGTYCSGLTIKSGANVTLNPGTYIVKGGLFNIAGSRLQGDGVTIVLADASAALKWFSSQIRLSAPKSGPTASLVVMADRTQMNHVFYQSTIDLHGAVYMPLGLIDWTNTGTPVTTAKWTAWIIGGFSWAGDGVINMTFDLASSDIAYPKSLYVIPRPGKARLVL